MYTWIMRRDGSDNNLDDDDDGEAKREASMNGSVSSSRADSKQGSYRSRSTRPGSAKSNRSGAGGGGIQFGSDYESEDDEFGSEFGGTPTGGMTPGGMSGFGAGAFGGVGASSSRVYGGGRTSRRVFGPPRSARSNRSRSRSDFGGGGGGAMDLLRQDSGVDNSPQLNASGQVIDTGIGVMPALDLARQRAGLPATSAQLTPVAGAAGGVLGDTGTGMGGSVRAGSTLGDVAGAGEEWEEDDEFSQVPQYLKGRKELEQSLGEDEEEAEGGEGPAVSVAGRGRFCLVTRRCGGGGGRSVDDVLRLTMMSACQCHATCRWGNY